MTATNANNTPSAREVIAQLLDVVRAAEDKRRAWQEAPANTDQERAAYQEWMSACLERNARVAPHVEAVLVLAYLALDMTDATKALKADFHARYGTAALHLMHERLETFWMVAATYSQELKAEQEQQTIISGGQE